MYSKILHKVKVLARTVKYVYSEDPLGCAVRDIGFLIQTALEMYLIRLGGQFIDSTADILGTWENFEIREYFLTESFQYLALTLAVWIFGKLIWNLRALIRERVSRRVVVQANYDIVSKVGSENLQEVEHKEFQSLVTFVSSYSVEKIFETYDNFTEVVRQFISTTVALFILSVSMEWSVFFLLIIAIPEPIFQYLGDQKVRRFRLSEVRGVKFVNYLLSLALDISAFAELKVNSVYKTIKKDYLKGDQDYIGGMYKHHKEIYSTNVIMAMIAQILRNVYTVYILAISIIQGFTIGHFKALFDYASSAYNSSYLMISNTFTVYDGLSYTEDFFKLLDYEGFSDITRGDKKIRRGTPTLTLENLDFEYPDGNVKVLENLNVTIQPGEKVAFLGGDGSGKSSLIKTLSGLYEIKAGDYTLGGYSVRELKRGELKKQLSVTFQNFIRYNFTLRENIILSGGKERINRILYEEVKKVTQIDRFMKKENLTDNQVLGKVFPGGREISPGYWQRIAIARMLYQKGNIYIMDEPFTHIDGESKATILKNVIKFLGKEKTLIYISQDSDHLKLFDKIYILSAGKIVESGSYDELIKKKGHLFKSVQNNS